MTHWLRTQRAVAIDVGADLVVLGDPPHRLTGDSADLARYVLATVRAPTTTAELVAAIERDSGPLGERRAVVDHLLDVLARAGAIASAPTEASAPLPGCNVVLGITGAIAATSAPALVVALQQRGHRVEIALTERATELVSVAALTAIARRAVHTSIWPTVAHAPVPHVALAAWAELVVIAPATATTIARLAHGDFSDLVSATALTTRAPVVVAPAMNPAMLDSDAVQTNLATLRRAGFAIVHDVPALEIADAPHARDELGGGMPAAGELVRAIDALRTHGALVARTASAWDAAYRTNAPWTSERCDADLAALLAAHAPTPRRVLDVGCGAGQVAVHAARAGHRVVAIDTSDVALAIARAHRADVVWLRDDICASALAGEFEVVVDRATLHALPRAHVYAWAASIRRLLAPGGIAIVKAIGWSASELGELLPAFTLVHDAPAELPDPRGGSPRAARLIAVRAPM